MPTSPSVWRLMRGRQTVGQQIVIRGFWGGWSWVPGVTRVTQVDANIVHVLKINKRNLHHLSFQYPQPSLSAWFECRKQRGHHQQCHAEGPPPGHSGVCAALDFSPVCFLQKKLYFVKWCNIVLLVKRFFCQPLFASAEKLPPDTVLYSYFFLPILSNDLNESGLSKLALKALTLGMDSIIADYVLQTERVSFSYGETPERSSLTERRLWSKPKYTYSAATYSFWRLS